MLLTPAIKQPQSLIYRRSNGPRIHVERYDSGSPPVLLLHGRGDGAFIWDLFAPVLARRLTTFAVDLRGHGDSDWDPIREYRLKDCVNDIAHVIDRCISDVFTIIGHSLCAHIAIHLCEMFSDRIRACVLVDYAPELTQEGIQQATTLLRDSLRSYASVNRYADWLKVTRHLTEPGPLEAVGAIDIVSPPPTDASPWPMGSAADLSGYGCT